MPTPPKPSDRPRRSGRPLHAVLALLGLLATAAQAQGGPPMVTDDPDTPGNGNWEINLAAIAQRSADGWLFTGTDADINYGWGERVQLKVDAPWNFRRQDGNWSSGPGKTQLGVKWRFFDDDKSGLAISTYPQIGLNPDPGAVRRGLTDPGRSTFLPLEASTHVGPIAIDVEVGRELQTTGEGSWAAGLILAHEFSPRFEAMLETRERWSGSTSANLLNVGAHWQFSQGLGLLAAIGREVGADPGRLSTLAYLGVQIKR